MMNNIVIMSRDNVFSPNFADGHRKRKRSCMHDIRIELPNPFADGGATAATPSSLRA